MVIGRGGSDQTAGRYLCLFCLSVHPKRPPAFAHAHAHLDDVDADDHEDDVGHLADAVLGERDERHGERGKENAEDLFWVCMVHVCCVDCGCKKSDWTRWDLDPDGLTGMKEVISTTRDKKP